MSVDIISIIPHLCTQRTGQFTDIFKQQWDLSLMHTLKIDVWYVKKLNKKETVHIAQGIATMNEVS